MIKQLTFFSVLYYSIIASSVLKISEPEYRMEFCRWWNLDLDSILKILDIPEMTWAEYIRRYWAIENFQQYL